MYPCTVHNSILLLSPFYISLILLSLYSFLTVSYASVLYTFFQWTGTMYLRYRKLQNDPPSLSLPPSTDPCARSSWCGRQWSSRPAGQGWITQITALAHKTAVSIPRKLSTSIDISIRHIIYITHNSVIGDIMIKDAIPICTVETKIINYISIFDLSLYKHTWIGINYNTSDCKTRDKTVARIYLYDIIVCTAHMISNI